MLLDVLYVTVQLLIKVGVIIVLHFVSGVRGGRFNTQNTWPITALSGSATGYQVICVCDAGSVYTEASSHDRCGGVRGGRLYYAARVLRVPRSAAD